MKLTGIHLLLTYRCTFECDHCFVHGSPRQKGTMTIGSIRRILDAAKELGTVEWIYFEGGEPFLYYAALLRGVKLAVEAGFRVGMVSNAYWATSLDDAVEWLEPLVGRVHDLSISGDLYHGDEETVAEARYACAAAEQLGIPVSLIRVAQPESTTGKQTSGQLPPGEVAVMYRGRAADKLVARAGRWSWSRFNECCGEELRAPDRVHVDPDGNVHVCQGVSIGNLFEMPLRTICERYDPAAHPVLGALLEGGPAELVRRHGLPHSDGYADACHLCYEARRALRAQYPETLMPDQMYGVPESESGEG